MGITEAAARNHEKLFPNHVSTLKASDPELVEVFDNFAFDEAKAIVYQAVPYCGIAKALDFIHATNEILVSRGMKLPIEGQSTTTPETRYEKGLALQKAIFGDYLTRGGLKFRDTRALDLLHASFLAQMRVAAERAHPGGTSMSGMAKRRGKLDWSPILAMGAKASSLG